MLLFKYHYLIHNSPLLGPALSHLNSLPTLRSCKTHLNITCHLRPNFWRKLLLSHFPAKTFYAFAISRTQALCLNNITFLLLITLIRTIRWKEQIIEFYYLVLYSFSSSRQNILLRVHKCFNINLLHSVYICFLLLLYVSTVNFGHLQGVTRLFDVYSLYGNRKQVADYIRQCQSLVKINVKTVIVN